MPTFVVVAHDHPTQLARLVDRLTPFPVIIHISARVDQRPFERAVGHLPNAAFLPLAQRVRVNWAGLSFVHALQHLLRAALARTDPDDHIVVLSGTDYPLAPVEEFAQYLVDAPFRQHIRYFDVGLSDAHHRRFVDRRHYRDVSVFPTAARGSTPAKLNEATRRGLSQAMRWYPPQPCPTGMRPMHGSTWCALTAGCVRDVLERSTPALDRWMARTFCPDEMYLHTLVQASPHAASTPHGGPIAYPGRGASALANFHLIDDSLNKFFTINDLPAIEASTKWFVRKVAPPGSDALLDHLDAGRLGVPTRRPESSVEIPTWTYATVTVGDPDGDATREVIDVESGSADLADLVLGRRHTRLELLDLLGTHGYEAIGVRASDRDAVETYYLKHHGHARRRAVAADSAG